MPDDDDIRAALRGLTADEPPLGFGSDEVVASGRRRQYRRGGMMAGVASIATAVAVTVPLMLVSGHDVAGTGSGGPPMPVPKTASPTCAVTPPLPTATALLTERPTAPRSHIAPPAPTESPAVGSSLPVESPSAPLRLSPTRATASAEPHGTMPVAPRLTQSPIALPTVAQPSDTQAPRATSSPVIVVPPPTCAPVAGK